MPELINRKVCKEFMEAQAEIYGKDMPQLSEKFWGGINALMRTRLLSILKHSRHKRLTDEDVWE